MEKLNSRGLLLMKSMIKCFQKKKLPKLRVPKIRALKLKLPSEVVRSNKDHAKNKVQINTSNN